MRKVLLVVAACAATGSPVNATATLHDFTGDEFRVPTWCSLDPRSPLRTGCPTPAEIQHWLAGHPGGRLIPHFPPKISIGECFDVDESRKSCKVSIVGEIMPNEADGLESRLSGTVANIFQLFSDGGNVMAAARIGEIVHATNSVTWVAPGAECWSACALIWAAGKTHVIEEGGLVVFHSAFIPSDKNHADGTANAYVGAYLASLGYSPDDAAKFLGHDPSVFVVVYRVRGRNPDDYRCPLVMEEATQ